MRVMGLESPEHIDFILYTRCVYMHIYVYIYLIIDNESGAMVLYNGWSGSFCSTDVFSTGIWEELDEFTDPELKRLAKAIPDAVLGSRASSTTIKYLGAFK